MLNFFCKYFKNESRAVGFTETVIKRNHKLRKKFFFSYMQKAVKSQSKKHREIDLSIK